MINCKTETTDYTIALRDLACEGHSFAAFRMPEENEVTYILQDKGKNPMEADDIEWLNGKSGFVIAPFRCSPSHRLLLISADTVVRSKIALTDINGGHADDVYSPVPEDGYKEHFSTFISALADGEFHKLVLSRKAEVKSGHCINIDSVFTEACRRYRHSYVYIFCTPQTGVWIGSTPEVLLNGSSGCYSTISLAGTQEAPDGDSTAGVTWNEKNRREQAFVSDYLRSRLAAYGVKTEESEPRTVRAGELVHLRTDFSFGISENDKIGSLLNMIHPTPAVCGLPKEEAYRFIIKNEGYDRSYYSGFVGMLNPDGETALYVNLRCMNVTDDVATLYAGGGLLPSSELNDEWLETERKMATMKRIIR